MYTVFIDLLSQFKIKLVSDSPILMRNSGAEAALICNRSIQIKIAPKISNISKDNYCARSFIHLLNKYLTKQLNNISKNHSKFDKYRKLIFFLLQII